MAAGLVTCRDTKNRCLDCLAAVQQHDPVHGPNKFRFAGAPTHAARNRQVAEGALDKPRHQRVGFLSFLDHVAGQPFTFVSLLPAQLVDRHAALFGKGGSRRRRIAVIIERDFDGRALLRALAIGLRIHSWHGDYSGIRGRVAREVLHHYRQRRPAPAGRL